MALPYSDLPPSPMLTSILDDLRPFVRLARRLNDVRGLVLPRPAWRTFFNEQLNHIADPPSPPAPRCARRITGRCSSTTAGSIQPRGRLAAAALLINAKSPFAAQRFKSVPMPSSNSERSGLARGAVSPLRCCGAVRGGNAITTSSSATQVLYTSKHAVSFLTAVT